MRMRRFWPDHLGGQIALLLSLVLALEFIGSEWLFQRMEERIMLEERSRHLSQTMAAAEKLLVQTPVDKRQAMVATIWEGPIQFGWQVAVPSLPLAPSSKTVMKDLASLELEGLLKRPGSDRGFAGLSLAPSRTYILGRWQLPDGSWVSFRSVRLGHQSVALHRNIGSFLLLLLSVAVVGTVIARRISLPLRKLAAHADGAGRADEALAMVEGPYEVRQVARAYNDLQSRMTAEVEDRLQALAAVSHDLRTPIARMHLRLSRLEDADLRAQMEQDLAEMDGFIGALLDYLSGGDPEPSQLVNVASLFQTIIYGEQDLGHLADYHGPATLEFVTKPVKLQRIMLNLVQNAVRHGGRADVYAVLGAENLEIRVEDEGPGIAEDQRERLFEPFIRLETSRNRQTGGAGLGLAIVKRGVERLGGVIRLENRASGGLRVHILLPLISTEADAAS